jgi:hypothetical protein
LVQTENNIDIQPMESVIMSLLAPTLGGIAAIILSLAKLVWACRRRA